MNDLLERRLVQEAVLLAETVAAVEASKSTTAAEEVQELHVYVFDMWTVIGGGPIYGGGIGGPIYGA